MTSSFSTSSRTWMRLMYRLAILLFSQPKRFPFGSWWDGICSLLCSVYDGGCREGKFGISLFCLLNCAMKYSMLIRIMNWTFNIALEVKDVYFKKKYCIVYSLSNLWNHKMGIHGVFVRWARAYYSWTLHFRITQYFLSSDCVTIVEQTVLCKIYKNDQHFNFLVTNCLAFYHGVSYVIILCPPVLHLKQGIPICSKTCWKSWLTTGQKGFFQNHAFQSTCIAIKACNALTTKLIHYLE